MLALAEIAELDHSRARNWRASWSGPTRLAARAVSDQDPLSCLPHQVFAFALHASKARPTAHLSVVQPATVASP
jgi:hypothetical protein